ncbi:hypothetical protein AAVH_30562 [Aphelenchoides avenae]|nr:hypothetical protein AAVH_30562 [Aphelenchus avenae]
MNNPSETAAQLHKAEERVGQIEAENDGLRTCNDELEQTYEDLTVVQREVSEEENDANAQNAEFVRAGSQVQHQVEQVTQKKAHSARTENHGNDLLHKRIASLEQELSQHKAVRGQYETLKTLHQNTQRQMEALKEKLDSAEMEVMSLKYQTRRLEDPRFTRNVVDLCLPKCMFADEMNRINAPNEPLCVVRP